MRLVVGRIGKAHGIRGDVYVEPFTDSPDERFADGNEISTSTGSTMTVESSKWHSGRLLIHFSGVSDRNAAEAIRGIELVADVDLLETPSDPDEFYDHQLVGLQALLTDGSNVGRISEVLHLPSQDVLVLVKPDETEVLIPFVSEIVPDVDVAAGTIRLTPPLGLLDDSEAIVVSESDQSEASL